MPEEITEFLDRKGIHDEFIRNIVTGFINRHTQLFGDVIPFEVLMERLNANLDSIVLADPNTHANDPRYQNVVGTYEGFNKNCITMFFTQEHLQSPQLREDFIITLLHELTHCAYTIKQNDVNKSEKQVFGRYEQQLDGKTPLVDGNNTYMEPIINYISTCIFGKKNGIYPAQTSNIAKLMGVLDEKAIVRSAFDSDEEAFRQCFGVLKEGAYEYYTEGMEWLNGSGEYGFRKGNEILNNFFNGNIPNLTQRQMQKKELRELKTTLSKLQPLQPLSPEQLKLDQGEQRTLKRHGFINIFMLILILIVVIGVVVTIILSW